MRNLLLLLRVRLQGLAHIRHDLREKSLFQSLFIALFSVAMLGGLWRLFFGAFQFMDRLGGIGLIILPHLFAFFFLSLVLMLVFSGIFTTYTTLYRSDETPFLVMHPLTFSELVTFKALESAFYATWAFYFVIIPFLGAYVQYERLPWHVAGVALLFSIPFTILCALIGALLMILLVRFVPRTRGFWGLTALLALAGGITWWTRHVPVHRTQEETVFIITRFVPFLSVSNHPLLPSWWMAEGVLSITRGDWPRGLLFLFLLVSSALMLLVIIEAVGIRLFYSGWQRSIAGARNTRRKEILFHRAERLCSFLPDDMRALVFKDARMFIRDPQQWMQALFFFGLLAIYFLSLGNMHYRNLPDMWKNLITFLNIFSIACVLCSLSSRFIYPQMSLEGQAFWVIGMAPTTMGRVLMSKFISSFVIMLAVSAGLMAISTGMLDIEPEVRRLAIFLAACLSCAIAGLSIGNGAIFINLKQQNPSAIVSSFGGTLNLVLSLLFMLLCIFPPAMLYHYREMGAITPAFHAKAIALAMLLLVLFTILSAVIPLAIARRSLCRRDY